MRLWAYWSRRLALRSASFLVTVAANSSAANGTLITFEVRIWGFRDFG